MRRLALFLLLCLMITASTAAQATPALYVDASAPPGGDCSQAAPCSTIGAALNKQRSGVIIHIAAGVYRESVTVSGVSGLTLEGESGAVISAFEAITDWREESDGTFSAPVTILPTATNTWPSNVTPTYAAGVRSPVFANGQRLMPVQGTPAAGQFALRDGRLYVRSTGMVEYGVRQYALFISGSNNITVRGLTVEGCANNIGLEGCLHISTSQNVTLEGVTASRGSYGGVQINSSSFVTVRNMAGGDNGVRGFGAASSSDILLDGAQLHRNGARTEWFAGSSKPLEYWDGGNKVFTCVRCTFRGMDIRDTYGPGFWVDWRNIALVIENSIVHNSHGSGVFVEAHCDTPSVTLRNVTISHTRTMSTNATYLNADLFITGTNQGVYENVRITSSTLHAVLVNNYSRDVGSCAPVRGTGNVFTGLEIARVSGGNAISLVNDTTGFTGTTRIGATVNSGSYRVNNTTLSAPDFAARLAAGSRIVVTGSGGAGGQPSPTPSATMTPVPTAVLQTNTPIPTVQTVTPVSTVEPTRAPDGRVRIIIDIFWWFEESP